MAGDSSAQSLEALADSIRDRGVVEPTIFFLELSKPLVGCMRELYGMSEPLLRTLLGRSLSPAIRELLSSADQVEKLIVILESKRASRA